MSDTDVYYLLQQQIKDYLQSVDTTSAPLSDFIQAIDASYHKFNADEVTLKKALALSAGELMHANDEMTAIFQAIPDQILHINNQGVIASCRLGQSSSYYLISDEPIGKKIKDVLHKEVAEKFLMSFQQVLEQQLGKHFDFVIVHDKRIYYYEVRMMPLSLNDVIALVRDITDRKLAEEQIAFLAYHDNLTALPNNRLFKDRLEHAILQAQRNKKMIAVMFLDLDRFKLINDTMGHSAGDELLKKTSQRLIEVVRKSDSVAVSVSGSENSASIARLGGDEFTILLEDVESVQSIIRIAERVVEIVGLPLTLGNQEVHISTSVGISMYPSDGQEADELLKNADTAMYHAKSQGRNNFQFYTAEMNQASIELLSLENNLRKAINNKELCLYYQPQINVKSGMLVGMEALIRWKQPDQGFISPGVFIPIAEETGMIMQIGEWVIREACEQGAAWIKKGYKLEKISVNLSARQLKDAGLPALIECILQETGMPVEKLCIELTESALILDPDEALIRLEKVKELGVSLSLDDFGTGYSSLSYLKRFPIDTLKIDQAFIRDVKVDDEDAVLVKAIIDMAHGLGMNVVAEGVESKEQLKFLGDNACDVIQGYLFSRPLAVADMQNILLKEKLF